MTHKPWDLSYMKLMLSNLEDFMDALGDMQASPLKLLLWLGSLHSVNGSHLKTTQAALAEKYGLNPKTMSNMISNLRKKGFLLTGKEQGVPILVINPLYIQFGDLKSYRHQEQLWHRLEAKTPNFKKQERQAVAELLENG